MTKLTLLAGLATLAFAPAQAVTIFTDDFSIEQGPVSDGSTGTCNMTFGGADAVVDGPIAVCSYQRSISNNLCEFGVAPNATRIGDGLFSVNNGPGTLSEGGLRYTGLAGLSGQAIAMFDVINVDLDTNVTAYLDGNSLGTVDILGPGTFTYDLGTLGGEDELSFVFSDGAAFDISIDDFSLSQPDDVPTPAAVAIFGLGAGLLGFARRHRS